MLCTQELSERLQCEVSGNDQQRPRMAAALGGWCYPAYETRLPAE